ncbi:MAG TPA: hypothetical protein PLF37_14635 [Planctomycetota bacterium]|nr:hypothetical protein [Planctomycetota bacterium]
MFTLQLRWPVLVLIGLSICGLAKAQTGESFKTGQKVSGSISLGKEGFFGSTLRHIPLPDGEWTVLHGESNTSVVQMARVFLAKHEAGKISELLIVQANTARGSSVRFPDFCVSADVIHQNKYDSTTWNQRCMEIRHDTGILIQKPGSGNKIKDGVVSLGLSAEPVMLWASYVQFDQKGDLLRFEHLVDPSKYEIDTVPSDYRDSPWHKSKLSGDARRSAFVKQFIDYSESLSDKLQMAFQFKPASPLPSFTFKE